MKKFAFLPYIGYISSLGFWGFLGFLSFLSAEIRLDPRGDQTVNNWSRYGAVLLEADKIRYGIEEDIPIRVKVKNKGYKTIRIYPSPLPNQSYQFFLTDKQGREIKQEFNARAWEKRARGASVVNLQQREEKEIILAPQESFEKVFYLNDFYQFQAGREYRLWLYFFPEQNDFSVRSNNSLMLHTAKERTTSGLHTFLKRQKKLALNPEETVYLFLSAEIQKKWPDYLKYLDLRKFITSYSSYASRYAEADFLDQELILKEFSEFLTKDPSERLRRFQILDSEPERQDGKEGEIVPKGQYFVRALGIRGQNGYFVRYEYRYALEPQSNGFWKIIHVEVKLIR